MPGDGDGLVTKHVKYYSRMSESDSNIELSQVNIQTAEHFRAEKIGRLSLKKKALSLNLHKTFNSHSKKFDWSI